MTTPAPEPGSVRAFALGVLSADTLDGKLRPPRAGLDDAEPGAPLRVERPGRPARLAIRQGPGTKVPPLAGMADPAQRARILHAFANHELQAVELFAWALLAFPDAPAAFRAGLLGLLADEQRHARLYLERLADLGLAFGDRPVSGYLWSKLGELGTPLEFVCVVCLTFENANLDHAVEYAAAARAAGDEPTAAVLDRVHADEVRHVRFGLRWLAEFKQADESVAQAWRRSLGWPLRPERAVGRRLHLASRREAGFDAEFLGLLREAADEVVP